MDQKQLDEIKERVENASMAPWKIYENEDGTCIGTVDDHPQLKSPLPVVGIALQGKEPNRIINIFKENAEFIALAREDVPALLAEVERLRTLANFEVQCSIKANQENKRLQDIITDIKSDILSIGGTIAEASSFGETLDMSLLSDKLHEIFLRLDGEVND